MIKENEKITSENLTKNANKITHQIVELIKRGFQITLIYDNWKLLRKIYLQNQLTNEQILEMPLSICCAKVNSEMKKLRNVKSQGMIGYILQQALQNQFILNDIKLPVVTLLTQIEIDENDISFHHPTKPIGNVIIFIYTHWK